MRDHTFFEGWARANNMFPVKRERDDSWPADILFADSGVPFFGENQDGIYGRWYRTAFAFETDQAWTASYCDYPAQDFDLISRHQGQQQRVNEAESAALGYLMQLNDSGLFDHARKADFAKTTH